MSYGNANIIANTIRQNQANNGSGVFIYDSDPLVENNILINNFSDWLPASKGTLYLVFSNPDIVGNLFANNDGSAIYMKESSPIIVNSTMVNNYNYYTAGMVFEQGSDPIIKNCIVYGNIAELPLQSGQIRIIDADSDPVFDHCDIQGGLAGFGGAGAGSNYNPANYSMNITTNPLWQNPTTGAGAGYDGLLADYSVQGNSPCINTGTTNGIINLLPALDLAGNPRINGIIDMGAYEYCAPAQPSMITGNANPCEGSSQVYSVTNVTGISYSWTVPSTWTITAGQGTNSITATVGSSAGDITVTPSNSCGSGMARTMTVTSTVMPDQPNAIQGNPGPCTGTTQSYSVNNIPDLTYTWTVPDTWSITSGQGTHSITATVGTIPGDIVVLPSNTCFTGPQQTFAVTVNTIPTAALAIQGNATVCQGLINVSYTVPIIPNAETYQWILPPHATGSSTTNSITLNFGLDATSGEISVRGVNDCGEGESASLFIQVNPLPEAATSINGETTVCANTSGIVYTTPEIPNATAYQWTLPAGVTGSSTTNSITLNFSANASSGEISVKGINDCGEGLATNLLIQVNHVPDQTDEITGNINPCQGYTGIYSVSQVEGITYTWIVPPGATIIDGQGSNAIVVNMGTSSGNIIVTPSNLCGNGLERSLTVTVNHPPSDTPSQASGPETVNSFNTSTSIYTTNAVANTNYYIWDLYPTDAGVLSEGNDTSVTVTWNTGFTGNCALVVKAVNNCGESPFSIPLIIYVDYLTSLYEVNSPQIKLYPNPSDGRFTIESASAISQVKLYDVAGRQILPFPDKDGVNINGALVPMDYRYLLKGLYFIHVYMDNQVMIQKVIIQ